MPVMLCVYDEKFQQGLEGNREEEILRSTQ